MSETYGMDMAKARQRALEKMSEMVDQSDLADHPPNTSGFESEPVNLDEDQVPFDPWWGSLLKKHPVTVVYPIQGVILSGFDVVIMPIDPRVDMTGGPGPGGHEPDPAVIRMTPFGAPMPGMISAVARDVRKGHRVILSDKMLANTAYRSRMLTHLQKEGIMIHRVELLAGDKYPPTLMGTVGQIGRHFFYEARRRLAIAIMGD